MYLVEPTLVMKHERERSKLALVLVEGTMLGFFGIDHMYAGNWGAGILKLATLGGGGVWWLVDYARAMFNALAGRKSGTLGVSRWSDSSMKTSRLAACIALVTFAAILAAIAVAIRNLKEV